METPSNMLSAIIKGLDRHRKFAEETGCIYNTDMEMCYRIREEVCDFIHATFIEHVQKYPESNSTDIIELWDALTKSC